MLSKNTLRTLICTVLIFTVVMPVHAHKLNPDVIEYLTGEKISYSEDHHTNEPEETESDPRDESRTYYSFPEWYIVYSAQEYGDFMSNGGRPSQFPYFTAISQQWEAWEQSEKAAETAADSTTNTILWTISLSFSAEYGLIGIYENTVGRVSEWLHLGHKTVEDDYIDAQAVAYGTFLNQTPWYEFPYLESLKGLWMTWGWSSFSPRGIERKIAYTVGYGGKAIYAGVIKFLSETNFEGGAGLSTTAVVAAETEEITALALPFTTLETNVHQVDFPRYRAFRDPAVQLALAGGNFISIQGHSNISLSVVSNSTKSCEAITEYPAYTMSIASQPEYVRHILKLDIKNLGEAIRSITACGNSVEHIYDY